MLNQQHGAKEEDVNFLILMIVIHHNFVQDQVLIVIGKETLWENVALICTLVFVIQSNIIPIQSVQMKIIN